MLALLENEIDEEPDEEVALVRLIRLILVQVGGEILEASDVCSHNEECRLHAVAAAEALQLTVELRPQTLDSHCCPLRVSSQNNGTRKD